MKIGIVTFQRADNQGALLQCYALYTYLKQFESNTEVIDYRNSKIEKLYQIFPIMKNPVAMIRRWLRGIRSYAFLKKRRNNFECFRRRIAFSPPMDINKLKKIKMDYDLIITGSGQVWNTDITRGFDDIYYLNFQGEYIRGSYAASIGNIENPDFQQEYFKKTLSAFDGLSVREKDAAEFISEIVSKSVVQCIDPTLLLNKSEWEKLAEDADVKVPKRYLLLYYVQSNSELLKIAEKIAKERNIPVVCFERDLSLNCKTISNAAAGPLEFLKLIQEAEVVVTSSFHATAFSCIFGKDVHIMAHSVTGARVVSLAEMFGIENRIYSSYSDFENRYDAEEKLMYSQEKYREQYGESEKYIKSLLRLAGGSLAE